MHIVFIFLSVFLISCSPNKEVLLGKRSNINTSVEHKKLNLEAISIPSPVKNSTWVKRGLDLNNNQKPLLLAEKLVQKWKFDIGAQGKSDIVMNNDTVYVQDAKGMVFAFDTKDKKILWQFDSTPKGKKADSIKGGLLILDDALIVSTAFGEVFSLDLSEGKPLWKQKLTAPTRSSGVFYKGSIFLTTISNETFSLDAKTGAIIWKHQGVTEIASFLGLVTPAISDDIVITAYTSGEYFALDYKTGDVLWGDTLTPTYRSDTMGNIAHISSLPVINNGKVYVMSFGGRAVCAELKTGEKIWEKSFGSGYDFAIAGNNLFFIDYSNSGIFAVDKNTGDEKWQFGFEKLSLKPKDMNFYAPFFVNNKLLLSTKSGKFIFIEVSKKGDFEIIDTDIGFNAHPIVVNGLLYTMSDSGYLVCYG